MSETDNPMMTRGASSYMNMQGLIPSPGGQIKRDTIEKYNI